MPVGVYSRPRYRPYTVDLVTDHVMSMTSSRVQLNHVMVTKDFLEFVLDELLRGNVGENQRGAPNCRRNLCSYSGYQKYSYR